ncbi:MAG: tRNA preQ1(34) S-adenosylmethionine ribosyltransferase-isomerase QueA [Acidobacteria bacterium]|nr:MAG: tRNA preQ1(34) S-adenosylmethionine ribosyltransferase-isomerase QueA [Acidobacteriota bacterium]
MRIEEFDYHLPPELIAQQPLPQRDQARMLIVHRRTGTFEDGFFYQLPSLLKPGTVVVINNTRVLPARLIGHRRGHRGRVEILLLRPLDETTWDALVKPARVLRAGTEVIVGHGQLTARIVRELAEGRRHVQFACPTDELLHHLERWGLPPLPPYIKRSPTGPWDEDRERYQTIYARHPGAVAAPTAGLHFTERIFQQLRARHIEVVELTHHVGYATFQSLRVTRVEEHTLEPELSVIPEETAERINRARREGRPILAVGTTTVRALESAADSSGMIRPGRRWADAFIYPGYRFRAIDALLTNFHLPRSTLLMLVCAFATRQLVLRAYRHAVDQRYRFYSYGDCMLLL